MAMKNNKYLLMENRICLEKQDQPDDQVLELILDHCYAPKISGLTDQFVNLEALSMIKVGLVTLEGFPTLPKLKKLELCDNQLTGGLELLSGSKNLQELDISGNSIKDLDTLKPLQHFHDLTNLDLYDCEVVNISNYRKKVFELLPSLVTLDGNIHEREYEEPDNKRLALDALSDVEMIEEKNQPEQEPVAADHSITTVDLEDSFQERRPDVSDGKLLAHESATFVGSKNLSDSEICRINEESSHIATEIVDSNAKSLDREPEPEFIKDVQDDAFKASDHVESLDRKAEPEVIKDMQDDDYKASDNVESLDCEAEPEVTKDVQDGDYMVPDNAESLDREAEPEVTKDVQDGDYRASDDIESLDRAAEPVLIKDVLNDDYKASDNAESLDREAEPEVIKDVQDDAYNASESVEEVVEDNSQTEDESTVANQSVVIVEEDDQSTNDSVDDENASQDNYCVIDEQEDYSDNEEEEDEEVERSDLRRLQEDISIQEIGSSEEIEGQEDTSYEEDVSEGEIVSEESDDGSDEEDEGDVTQIYNASPSSHQNE